MNEIEDRMFQKESWDSIIVSESWFVFLDLIKERQEKLQKEVNKYVKNDDIVSAGKSHAKMEEYNKLIERVKEQVKKFNKSEVEND